ncbi:MAG: hypothetical protein WAT09_18175 [Paracoccaceae bacterium]
MTDRPKTAVPYPYAPLATEGIKLRPEPLRKLSPLEQMYAYFGSDRA